ncbi:hypothetical protein IFM89_030622 [Coptis chinensis]|uniref:BED-type domain-containing protein n=1 Tax=Coptis chinensis TaxID=261450 RepID=A0A835HQH7_9MAGN|nr:hypothetical protein IFM89_030622 [Coptis chinensis]
MEFDKYGHIVVDGMLPQEHIPKVEDCPSPLMAMMPPPTESASSHPSNLINGYEATSSRKRRVNPGKSDSWNHFDVVDVKKDDGTLETKARCRYCRKLMSCVASNGTSHLRRHTESCLSKNTHSIRPEQVTTTPPGEVVVNSPFDQARACRDTAKLVIELELPFSWAEDSHFEEWVHSFNPHLEPISRHTIKDIVLENTYILNKIVDEGLEGIHHSLENIRRSIRHVRSSKVNLQKFSELCKRAGMIFKNLPPDIPCHWNTTYYMLDAAIPYQRIFELFFYDSIHDFIPSIIDWKNATVMRDLLKAFCESSKLFSGISNVSSSKFCHQLSNICLILSKYENDSSCRGVVGSMKSKLSEYWREIPLVLGLAACMDPRYKLTFLEVCLEVICGYEETHRLGGVVEKIKNALEELCKEYTKDSNVMKEVSDEYELKQGCNVEGSGVMSSASTQKEDLTFALPDTQSSTKKQAPSTKKQLIFVVIPDARSSTKH